MKFASSRDWGWFMRVHVLGVGSGIFVLFSNAVAQPQIQQHRIFLEWADTLGPQQPQLPHQLPAQLPQKMQLEISDTLASQARMTAQSQGGDLGQEALEGLVVRAPRESGYSSAELGLKEIVRLSVGRHPTIADAIATLDQEDAGIDVAKAGYYPQVRMGFGSGNSSSTSSSSSSSLLTVSASQMLYDFGKVDAAVSSAHGRVRRQQGQVLRQIDVIAQQAADTAVMLHRYQKLEGIALAQIKAVQEVYEMARLRGEAGLSTQADPIQAWSRVDAARVNYLQIKSQHRQWQERLRTLLGPGVPLRVATFPEALLGQVSSDQQVDGELLPEVLIAKAELQVASAQLDSAKAQRKPTFTLDTSVNKSLNGVDQATMRSDGTSYSVMLNVSSSLFQGGALNAQVRGASAAEDAAHKRIETALLNADDQARSFREQLHGAYERLSVLADRRRSINEVRDLYREQYTLGTRTVLDLLNAEQEIYQAAQDEETVRHDLWQAWVGRVAATGLSREIYEINGTAVQGLEVAP